jgi:hypothetical protein
MAMSSKILSLKLKEDIFAETEAVLKTIHRARNAYLNDAISFYNKLQKRKILKGKLKQESQLVAQNSLEILHEFEEFSEDYE